MRPDHKHSYRLLRPWLLVVVCALFMASQVSVAEHLAEIDCDEPLCAHCHSGLDEPADNAVGTPAPPASPTSCRVSPLCPAAHASIRGEHTIRAPPHHC